MDPPGRDPSSIWDFSHLCQTNLLQEIDNPEYKPDDDLYMREDWGSIGIDIW